MKSLGKYVTLPSFFKFGHHCNTSQCKGEKGCISRSNENNVTTSEVKRLNYIEYRNNKIDRDVYNNDLKYWCNALGELHFHGKYDIEESGLPGELARAYRDLWSDGNGSLCYLVDFAGKYGIALTNEFDKCFADNLKISMDELYKRLILKAKSLCGEKLFKKSNIVVAEYNGFNDCHELIVILPTDTDKNTFKQIETYLMDNVYKM